MNQESSTNQIDIRQRVFSAADELYSQADREKFPTVDAVRRASKADMNSVSLFMKEWRHAQTTQAAPIRAVSIPEAVQAAHAAALALTWTQATDLANQNLQAAQAGWEAERIELDGMRAELAAGYELVSAAELAVRAELATVSADLDAERHTATAAAEAAAQHATEMKNQIAAAQASTATADARVVEIEHRVEDLKTALLESQAAAHAAALLAANELDAERQRHATATEVAAIAYKAQADRLDAAFAELATVKARATAAEQSHAATTEATASAYKAQADRLGKIETERDEARATASTAREQAAKLHGSTEAMQSQIAELLRALADRQPIAESAKKPAIRKEKPVQV